MQKFPFPVASGRARVFSVVSDASSASRRLSDLNRAQPADRTLQNLLDALSVKVDLCSRLPMFEYEATSDGHEASAATFRALAEIERRTFEELRACLQRHLEETAPPRPAEEGANR